MPLSLSEQIANLVLDAFESLPAKCKPRFLDNGQREWTPLSALVLHTAKSDHEDHRLKLISLATGTKSLPVSMIPKCEGLILHDCHAEILALRGFNYWLLMEMQQILASDGYESPWMIFTKHDHADHNPPFRIRDDVEMSLFSTEAPCGDASMEMLISASKAEGQDVSPWPVDEVNDDLSPKAPLPPGRGYFSQLGVLRRKPARADAEICMSMSCTDKLTLRQFSSICSFPADLFIYHTPSAFLHRLIVYQDQYSEEGYQRAFSSYGRLSKFATSIPDQPKFFKTITLPHGFRRFTFEKHDKNNPQSPKPRVSNISALWIAGHKETGEDAVVEVLINGVKQGFKQLDVRPQKGSVVCRRRMADKAIGLAYTLEAQGVSAACFSRFGVLTYTGLKCSPARQRKVKLKEAVLAALGGWPSSDEKDDFSVSVISC